MFLDRIPVRLRLSLGHAIWMALLFTAVGTGLYRVVEHNLYQSVDAALRTSARSIRDARHVRGFRPLLMERFLHQFFGEDYFHAHAQLVDLSGKVSAKTNARVNLPVTPHALARAERGLETFESFRDGINGFPLRQVTLPVMKFGRFTGELIQVGTSMEYTSDTLREFSFVLWVSLPLGFGLSIIFGYLLTARAFKPVNQMSLAAASMSGDDLSVRLPLPQAHDELRQLACTFNEMMDRLEDAFKRLRRFTGDVSHELRTPLAVLKGEAELALRRERSPEAYCEALGVIAKEADQMTGIIEDLLLLARAESRSVAMHWMRIEREEFVRDLVNVVEPVFQSRSVELEIDDANAPDAFEGNQGYLTLSLKNILLNAAKHSPKDSKVKLVVRDAKPGVQFVIQDFGEGIPPESLPYIFDPFYRADTARNRAAGGTGIGLSLAMALVKLHHGSLTVASEVGQGAVFTAIIPPAPEPTEDQSRKNFVEQVREERRLELPIGSKNNPLPTT